MPGITIEDDCIIGAGSVVTKSIPAGSIAAGNPAVLVGETKGFLERMNKFNCGTKNLKKEMKLERLLSLEEEYFIKKPFIKKRNS